MQFFSTIISLAALASAAYTDAPYPAGNSTGLGAAGTGTGTGGVGTVTRPAATDSAGRTVIATITPSASSSNNPTAGGATTTGPGSTGAAAYVTAVPGMAAIMGGAAYLLL